VVVIIGIIVVLSSNCNRDNWNRSKPALILTSLLFAIVGAILTGLGVNDDDECVSFRTAGIVGTIYTGIGIILVAITSI
jgi:hypothetical protein